MEKILKKPPPYVITSVDHALRIAAILQLEEHLTVTDAARRLAVAPSTAHRLLQTLVYRDFAVQDSNRAYRVGPILELAAQCMSMATRLRASSAPHLRWLVDHLHESANLTIRTGVAARFISSVESDQILRVGSREGMVFPAHQTTGGLLLLAELTSEELASAYASTRQGEPGARIPDLKALAVELARIRHYGYAINSELSERGVIAVGVPIRDTDHVAVAGLSVSLPSVRFEQARLATILTSLRRAASAIEADFALTSVSPQPMPVLAEVGGA
ncbi:MAG: IclR family transcriptional regulator [Propionibacteriaceae bacterium]|nr:IclR family transcriptional regulator [Propionibacteriaceae bacterium]